MAKPLLQRKTLAYRGRAFQVERDVVILPNGRRAQMDIVRHPGSVVLIPEVAAKRIILIRQYRYVLDRSIWELPAGTLEPGEAPGRAARRECEEETGWRPGRVRRLGAFYPTPGFCDERMIFYLCTGLTRPTRPATGDDDEVITPKVFTVGEAWQLVDQGRIIDMKTVLGLLLVGRDALGTRYRAPRVRPAVDSPRRRG
jgi:ADP-ribose pyrophosphatase